MGWLSTHRRSRSVLLVVTGMLVGLLLLAFALAGIDRLTTQASPEPAPTGKWADDPTSPPAAPKTEVEPSPGTAPDGQTQNDPPPGALPAVPATDEPDIYAVAIADVLYGMDYTTYGPGDYEAFFADALWDQIDPDDSNRILTTINRRIPTTDMWQQMRSIEQTSEFEVELVWEPRTGRDHREAGNWPDGVVTRNVSGTQTETWQAPEQDVQTSTRPVAVTVAMACPPAASPCQLVGILPNVGT